ncbi:uncharacterized protein JCM6883_000358 [Sporobolomyces salmoneus]|uniref:uncharacterized protein n=1 Tax=Sporobolomyces salmoneus TaxID=183962 RepID=UPI00317486D9
MLMLRHHQKAGYVRPQGWDTSFDEENVTSLVPQGLMYAHLYDCRRVLFSDYENGVALYIEEDKSQEEELAFTVASHECHGPRGGPNVDTAAVLNDPVNLGLRSTTAFLGVCALNELGVLDYGQVPFPAKHQISSLDARLEAIRILEPPGPEPQPEAAPTLKTFKFHHPPPPNERPKRATRGSGRSG